jgi:quercetin dioxygenase-like cupin family protein
VNPWTDDELRRVGDATELQLASRRSDGTLRRFTTMWVVRVGDVWIDAIAQGRGVSPISIGSVHFAPGARTAWHSHSIGQTLYVIEGKGRVQSRGEAIVTICPGDVVHTPEREWHWHGAAPDQFMTHLS